MDARPIGLLDSGIGGLSIWHSIAAKLPKESTIYIGDQRFVPYGNKTKTFIRDRVCTLISFLLKRRAKLIVIACNTATVIGIDYYRREYPLVPIIGIVPVVKTAASQTKRKHIGIFSTYRTARSAYQKRLIALYAQGCEVENVGNRTLVQYVERGDIHTDAMRKILSRSLMPMIRKGVDVIALGCSHYSFMRSEIYSLVGSSVKILDSADAVARHTKLILTKNGQLNTNHPVSYRFYTTGNAQSVSGVAFLLTHSEFPFRYVRI